MDWSTGPWIDRLWARVAASVDLVRATASEPQRLVTSDSEAASCAGGRVANAPTGLGWAPKLGAGGGGLVERM